MIDVLKAFEDLVRELMFAFWTSPIAEVLFDSIEFLQDVIHCLDDFTF